jgi:hypothetical protein
MKHAPEDSLQKSLRERLRRLRDRACREFEEVSDFFWKAPKIIDHERKLELRKLDEYFPESSDFREFRWRHESHKLDHTFPYLIAVGNLFSAVSLFESYLLLLAGELQTHSGVLVSDTKGQGIGRLFAFFRRLDVAPEGVTLHEQVTAAIKIRNCLMHASGMLDWSRESDELQRIQSTGAYLSNQHRRSRLERGVAFDEVSIMSSDLGNRLAIDNGYSHLLCSYLRIYFTALCDLVQQKHDPVNDIATEA